MKNTSLGTIVLIDKCSPHIDNGVTVSQFSAKNQIIWFIFLPHTSLALQLGDGIFSEYLNMIFQRKLQKLHQCFSYKMSVPFHFHQGVLIIKQNGNSQIIISGDRHFADWYRMNIDYNLFNPSKTYQKFRSCT